MKTVVVVANGPIQNISIIPKDADYFVAVDGGLRYLHAAGISPDLIVGDLDSVSPDLLARYATVSQKVFPQDKDHTDLELALACVPQPAAITVYGVFGGRIDHTLSNLYLLERYPEMHFIGETESVCSIQGTVTFATQPGQTVSLLSLGAPAYGVSSKGLRWELVQATVSRLFFSQSNEALHTEVMITIEKGSLLCILQTSYSSDSCNGG